MEVTSVAFEEGGNIPAEYTCDGRDISPPLRLSDVPPEAVSLVLVMDDPDAPGGTWDHWVEFNVPVTDDIPEAAGSPGTPGRNSWGSFGYRGPCPPRGTHRYFFTVYALAEQLNLPRGTPKEKLLEAIQGKVLAEATLMGRYSREG